MTITGVHYLSFPFVEVIIMTDRVYYCGHCNTVVDTWPGMFEPEGPDCRCGDFWSMCATMEETDNVIFCRQCGQPAMPADGDGWTGQWEQSCTCEGGLNLRRASFDDYVDDCFIGDRRQKALELLAGTGQLSDPRDDIREGIDQLLEELDDSDDNADDDDVDELIEEHVDEQETVEGVWCDDCGVFYYTKAHDCSDNEDIINEPSHYQQARVEPIEITEDLDLGYHLGNALKYLFRFQFKGSPIEDLKKCRFFVDRKIQLLEEENYVDTD